MPHEGGERTGRTSFVHTRYSIKIGGRPRAAKCAKEEAMDQGVRSSPMLSRVDKRSVCNEWRLRNDMSSIARELTSLATVRVESTDKRARLRIFDSTPGVPFLLFLMTVVAFSSWRRTPTVVKQRRSLPLAISTAPSDLSLSIGIGRSITRPWCETLSPTTCWREVQVPGRHAVPTVPFFLYIRTTN